MRLSLKSIVALFAAAALWVSLSALPANAQFGGGGGGGGFGGGGGGGQGTQGASGVVVDANGVVQRKQVADPGGRLSKQRIAQSMALLDGDLAQPSKLRKVSLMRLEKELAQSIAADKDADEAMKHLAGLTQIDYVFCYPATEESPTGDVVIAGPAEPWANDMADRTLGVESGRPVLLLEDLITALRAFPPRSTASGAAGNEPLIYCSIDPTQDGLQRMQRFLANTRFTRPPNQAETRFFVQQLSEQLGMQEVTVGGVPATTHFAQVLVEADYRMKLIGIGLEKPPVRLNSYVDRANPAMVSRNAMQRWYFVPDYECLRVSDDGLAMEVVGEGVKLIGEDEFVGQDGTRRSSGRSNGASNGFVKSFTKIYPKLAERTPIYAQLRNCIDLAVAAAFIQDQDFYSKTEWTMPVFGSEQAYPVETHNAPQQVATAVNSIWKRSTLMTPIGGGVEIRPTWALRDSNQLEDDGGSVYAERQQAGSDADTQRWWWD